jgi:tetratricopeptide (TPR) repeat protein
MSISIPTDPGNKLSERVSALWQQVGSIAFALGAFAIVVALQTPQLATLKHQANPLSKADLQREETKTKVQLALMKTLPTFGFDNLIADLHFMDFLQYFGDGEVRSQAGYGAAVDYFDVILDRDPWFIMGYYYLSNTASLYAGQPDRSVELMDRGLKSFSPRVPDRGYYIWRMKAVDELLFLGKVPEAKQSMLTAAGWARQNPDDESQRVAQISQATADHLARNPNSKQAQFDAWNMVLSSAVDETAIERAIAAIRSLGGKVTIGADGQMKVDAPPKD